MTTWVVSDTGGWVALGSSGLPASGVTPGTYGDSTHVGQFTVNAAGQVTAASDVAISGSSGGGWTVFDYAAVANDTTITSTTSPGQTLITGSSVAYDGSTRILVEFSGVFVIGTSSTTAAVLVNLCESGSVIARLCQFNMTNSAAASIFTGHNGYIFTPSAGAHQYTIQVQKVGSQTTSITGIGGAEAAPSWYRISSS